MPSHKQLENTIGSILEMNTNEIDIRTAVMKEYQALSDKCDTVLEKIKRRKASQANPVEKQAEE